MTPEQLIKHLNLTPLEFEGGYFRRTFFSDKKWITNYTSEEKKHLYSAIYYLLTPDTFSRIHRLPYDEIFHFYLGDPVEQLILNDQEVVSHHRLGSDVLKGELLQYCVAGDLWQGCRLVPGGKFALMGTTMSPAFDEADFETPDKVEGFVEQYPTEYRDIIESLLR